MGARRVQRPHTRTKDELILALHGKGEVIVEGGETYAMEPYTFIHIPAGTPIPTGTPGTGLHSGQLRAGRALYRAVERSLYPCR